MKKRRKKKRRPRIALPPEKLSEFAARVEEWARKEKEARRALRLAKTKLSKYRAKVRYYKQVLKKLDPAEIIGYDDKGLAAVMREKRRMKK